MAAIKVVVTTPSKTDEPTNAVATRRNGANRKKSLLGRCCCALFVVLFLWAAIVGAGVYQLVRFTTIEPRSVDVAPSAVAVSLAGLGPLSRVLLRSPREMTLEEIGDVVERFGRSAALCEECGFDGIQIHCAHGYLISQFLSPRSNRRVDRYGGSPENRRRLDPVQVIHETLAAGFVFEGFSELHYRLDDELRYEVGRRSVSGNTDRFTLRLRKPE